MPLEDLLELVETLRKRIGEHGQLLSQNETRTRYALIDPLLWGVGWDTEDPAQVVPEYALAPKSADYALLGSDGRPTMIVEAKRLDRPLRDGLSQSIAYCVEQGTPYFCVTDGRRWAIYETFRQVPVDKKLVTEFDVLKDSPAEVCLKALALWRPSVVEGNVREGETPVAGGDSPPAPETVEPAPQWACPECGDTIDESETRRIAGHKAAHTRRNTATQTHRAPLPPPTPSRDAEEGWVSLAELEVVPFAKPRELLLPTGKQISTPSWVNLVTGVAQWLLDERHLSGDSRPIQIRERYILATRPTHPNGKEFKQARHVGPLSIETNYSGADTIRNAQRIIKHAGLNPADFKVRLAD